MSSLPPLVVPQDGGWLRGSYDSDELDAIQAFTEGWSMYDPDLGEVDADW